MTQVAVVGAGLIGRAWSIVFARAGFDVALWDPYPQQIEAALTFISERLPELEEAGLLKEPAPIVAGRVRSAGTLAEAVAAAEHVQENGPERVDAKQALFGELDRRGVGRHGARQLDQRHSCQRVHRGAGRAGAMPGRASGQPAISDPSGRTVPRALDRPCGGVANACADDQCGPGAGHGEQGDGRVRAEPAAGRAARRGVQVDRG